MPNLVHSLPSYRRHKSTGQAVVTLGGRDIYLGKYKSAASRAEYNRVIAEWTANDGTLPQSSADLTVAELMAAFLKYAQKYHPPKERERLAFAMRPLKALYATTRVVDFGPIRLKAVRQKMIESDLARKTINERVNRLRYIFKWGVENELVPASTLHALQAVAGLRFGKTEARESEPVRPVPDAFVDEVLQHVSRPVAAMIELQRITGMRSGEVTTMRGTDINMAGAVWVFTPQTHKTAYRGHVRKVYLGPKAQNILRPFVLADVEAYLFSPQETLRLYNEARGQRRQTPLSCGNRPGTNKKRHPKKTAGVKYDTASYRRAIKYGILAANRVRLREAREQGIEADKVALVPDWHPHQLRHNAATNLRREHGIEVARIILGHRSPAITEVYAEVDHARAINVMAEVG